MVKISPFLQIPFREFVMSENLDVCKLVCKSNNPNEVGIIFKVGIFFIWQVSTYSYCETARSDLFYFGISLSQCEREIFTMKNNRKFLSVSKPITDSEESIRS